MATQSAKVGLVDAGFRMPWREAEPQKPCNCVGKPYTFVGLEIPL